MARGTSTARHILIAILGTWLGALLAVGAAAAVAFPTMKRLNPSLPEFGAVDEHWSIAAGSVFQPMFIGVLIIAVGLGVLATSIGVVAVRHASNGRRVLLNVLLISSMLAAAVGLVVARDMRANWLTFLDAARAGDTTAAANARSSFDQSHPLASTLLKGQAAMVFITLAAATLGGRAKEPGA